MDSINVDDVIKMEDPSLCDLPAKKTRKQRTKKTEKDPLKPKGKPGRKRQPNVKSACVYKGPFLFNFESPTSTCLCDQ